MTDRKDNSPSELDYILAEAQGNMVEVRRTRKAKQAILEEMDRVVAEVIGEDRANIATDDLIRDHDISFAIQRRVKRQQRNCWQEVRKGLAK